MPSKNEIRYAIIKLFKLLLKQFNLFQLLPVDFILDTNADLALNNDVEFVAHVALVEDSLVLFDVLTQEAACNVKTIIIGDVSIFEELYLSNDWQQFL